MKFPKTIRACGQTITIDCSKELEGLNGKFSSSKNTIHICKTLPQTQKEATFFHELLHALNATMGDTHDGHMLLESLSQQLYQVLTDNKMLR